ncbi:MAG: DUF4293 domain-containing protein [Prevotella sp.]|nr:DUF4293 domain-containing protein [Prevotella sp.]
MIQRKQSVFLLIAVILSVLGLCMQIGSVSVEGLTVAREYSLWVTDASGGRHFTTWPLFAVLLLSAALSLYTIFIYKRRLLQARLCLLNTLLLVVWYIIYTALSRTIAPDASTFRVALAAVFPAVSIILNVLARKAIIADEKLVRAADRIR